MELQQVVRLAKEAGFNEESAYRPVVQRFAELVAAEEREACARVAEGFVDERDDRDWVPNSLYGNLRAEVAAKIRARNKYEPK